MIIKKPYVFLIKHFRKIHIFLLIIGLFIYYKHATLVSFIRDFINFGAYDANLNPISNYIPWLFILLVLVEAFISGVLLVLLKNKSKPWKLYLLPLITYLLIFLLDLLLRSYFVSYTGSLDRASISLYRDLSVLTLVAQFPIFIIWLIRIFGINLKRFNFQLDQEYLEMSEDDKEEVEINFNFDKEEVFRTGRRLKRNIGYVYAEHKGLFNTILTIIGLIILYRTYVFIFITNKSYKQNDVYKINGYSIVVKDSYYTDKDGKGDIIEPNRGFIILNVHITNNAQTRKFNVENFHVINGVSKGDYTKTYESDFDDLGRMDDSLEIKRDASKNYMLVFKVDSKLDIDRFVLYYQEKGTDMHLRKIKLKTKDLSKINTHKEMELGKSFKSTIYKKEEEMSLDNANIDTQVTYNKLVCNSYNECETKEEYKTADTDKFILILEFGTEELEGEDLINICTKYGKIEYLDSKGKKKYINAENALSEKYLGKYAYLSIPDKVQQSSSIKFVLTIRNNRYIYKIR